MCMALVWVARESMTQPDLKNAVIYPKSLQRVPEFQLVDHDNNNFDLRRLDDKWSFLFVGYTLCPDVCPTTLQQMHQAHDLIKQAGLDNDVQYLFVSIDPERDELVRLKSYVQYFDGTFIGLTGTRQQLDLFIDTIGADYYKVKHPDEPRFYYMVHSAEIFLFNPEGRLYAMFPPPHQSDEIARDFAVLRKEFRSG